jgi:CheY-like chemotaxis protein
MNRLREKIRAIVQNDLEHSRSAMQWGGLLGFFAHPIYFFIWAFMFPQPYDNFYLRLSASIFCLPLVFQKYWPKRYESYLVGCWYFCLIYALPFVCTFLAIKNSFTSMWMMTEVMAIFILALCIDIPLLLLACVVIGVIAAFLAVIFTSELPLLLSNTDQASLALLPVILISSMLFSNEMRKGRSRASLEKTKALTGLAGSIAHEMRNPLSHIKYAADSITNAFAHGEQINSAEIVNKIYLHLTQISTAVNRGLQVIDITLREVADKPINSANFDYLSAATITGKAIEEYGFDSPDERNKVTINVLNDFSFKVDETAYIYIIFNLIKNALYYLPSHPDATIIVTIDHQKIAVTDNGPGIPQHVLNNLFKNFTTAGKADGTGLGLAYCQRAMHAFGGNIRCESVVGQYTTFTLTFPVISQEEIDAHTKTVFQETIPLFKHKRILVVDDQIIFHASVRHMLEDLGCQIDGADNGQVAINMLKENRYDLIVMDLLMSVKDGYITTEEIRSGIVPNQKNIAILAHTSELPNAVKIKTQKVGMDGFVGKPCTQIELIKAVYQTMECAQHRNSLETTSNYLTNKTILIVDDELINRQYLEIYANEWGMHTLHANNGQAAIEIVENTPHIDIVFMDMEMPLMNGVEATQRLRANPKYKDLIIITLTGNFSEQSIQEARASGMNDFITKPFDKTLLRQKLIQLIAAKNQPEKSELRVLTPATSSVDLPTKTTHDAEIKALTDSPTNRYISAYQSQESFFINMPLIDYTQLTSFQSNFKNKFQEFLQRFLNNLIERNEDLQNGLQNKDMQAILRALHSLVGAAAYIGAHALHQYIKQRLYSEVHAGHIPNEEAWAETVHALVNNSVDVLRKGYLQE